jgi:hypothetical protein
VAALAAQLVVSRWLYLLTPKKISLFGIGGYGHWTIPEHFSNGFSYRSASNGVDMEQLKIVPIRPVSDVDDGMSFSSDILFHTFCKSGARAGSLLADLSKPAGELAMAVRIPSTTPPSVSRGLHDQGRHFWIALHAFQEGDPSHGFCQLATRLIALHRNR